MSTLKQLNKVLCKTKKLNILESKYNELKEKEAQRLEKAIKLTDELTNKIIKKEV